MTNHNVPLPPFSPCAKHFLDLSFLSFAEKLDDAVSRVLELPFFAGKDSLKVNRSVKLDAVTWELYAPSDGLLLSDKTKQTLKNIWQSLS